MHVGKPVVTSGVTIGELLVIEAHEVKDRGMEIVDMDAVVSENSNRPVIMPPPGSSNEAIRLTARDIQRSLHLSN